jgi:hypothetical protein
MTLILFSWLLSWGGGVELWVNGYLSYNVNEELPLGSASAEPATAMPPHPDPLNTKHIRDEEVGAEHQMEP